MRNEIARNQCGGRQKFFLVFISVLLSLSTLYSLLSPVYAALSCTSCHGTPGAYGNRGLPDYTSAANKMNSHVKHYDAGYSTCSVCHIEVSTANYVITYATNHVNGKYDVPASLGYQYIASGSSCTAPGCHSLTYWGGPSLKCADCHLSSTTVTPTDGDVDNYVYNDGTKSRISTDVTKGWYGTGHGRATAYESGRSGANFGTYCEYCHDGTKYAHNVTTNPFRLANTDTTLYNAFGDAQNGVCLVCHSTVTAGGYDPPGAAPAKNATVTKATFTFHVGAGPNQGQEGTDKTDGGRYCWDCHDPHGDWSLVYPSTLAYMIQARPVELTAGTTQLANSYGVPVSTVTVSSFTKAMNGTAGYDWGDYAVASFGGICQTCHDAGMGTVFDKDNYDTGHNAGQRCTECHEHKNYFIGKGECISCHDKANVNRRAIKGEFSLAWTHMRSSTPIPKVVTNMDCARCHMEGDLATGKPTDGTYHKEQSTTVAGKTYAGFIQLRNPDTKAMIQFSSWSGTGAGAYSDKNWSFTGDRFKVDVGSVAFVYFFRDTTKQVLEGFIPAVQNNLCLKCHDETGGAAVDPGNPTRPFYSSTGVVVNVSSHFATTNASYHPISGRQNNSYCDSDTMNIWNPSPKTAGTTTAWGDLISCFDCHIATATAHGNPATLRAAYYTGVANVATELCVLCHLGSLYWGATVILGKSAFDGTTDEASHLNTSGTQGYHIPTQGAFTGCICCHGSAFAADPGRRTRAVEAHGFNTLPSGEATWTTSGARPYAFLRIVSATLITDWRPESWPGSGTFAGGYCTGEDHCGLGQAISSAYEPGGNY